MAIKNIILYLPTTLATILITSSKAQVFPPFPLATQNNNNRLVNNIMQTVLISQGSSNGNKEAVCKYYTESWLTKLVIMQVQMGSHSTIAIIKAKCY